MAKRSNGKGSSSGEDEALNTGVWKPDANEVNIEFIFDSSNSLLHLNNEISDFLDIKNKSKTIIIAPKGYGKTLLLKAKCKQIRNDGLVKHVIPNNESLIDQPIGVPYHVDDSGKTDVRNHVDYWHALWLIAFGIAISKEIGGLNYLLSDKDKKISAIFYNLIKDDQRKSISDIFGKLTGLGVGDYNRIRSECLEYIVPMIRNTNVSVATFVDSIDQYYESILRENSENSINRIAGNQHKKFWYLSQLGLALAASEINRTNTHIKTYVAIRKEVLQKAISSMHVGLQLRGKSLIVHYSHSDLEQIIRKNIRLEKPDRLARPKLQKTNPIEAFFGEVKELAHPVTGDLESITNFWIRHTLGRPRDIASIGARLSMINPADRSGPHIRGEIRKEARVLAEAYIGEMYPHLDNFDHRIICGLIDKNALSADDVEKLEALYDQKYSEVHGTPLVQCGIFPSLFKIGLLGYVGFDAERGELRQIFRAPGEEQLDDGSPIPPSDTYVVHPALSEIIFALKPNYFLGLNKRNIVGPNLIWRTERQISYILTGDVAKSSQFAYQGAQLAFEQYLANLAQRMASGLDHFQVEGGDKIKLLHQSPVVLLRVAQNLNAALRTSDFKSVFRFAGDAGFLSVQIAGENKTIIGDPVFRSARLEPLVKPGEIYITDAFYENATPQLSVENVRVIPCVSGDMETASGQIIDMAEGKFDISKEHEAKQYRTIYRLEFS